MRDIVWQELLKRTREGHAGSPGETTFPTFQPVRPLSEERLSRLKEAQEKIGYRFDCPELLDLALTHKSYSHESIPSSPESIPHYESLEFLGDSILGFIISEFLYLSDPSLSEGELSKARAFLVSTHQLHRISQALELGKYLQVSRGEEKTGGRRKKAILADLFESVVAAIYLDGGMDRCRKFITDQFRPLLEELVQQGFALRDYKSCLQERLHEAGLKEPYYRVVSESGPDHRKHFWVEVCSQDRVLAQGSGSSKKEAQQQAAKAALEKVLSRGRNSRKSPG